MGIGAVRWAAAEAVVAAWWFGAVRWGGAGWGRVAFGKALVWANRALNCTTSRRSGSSALLMIGQKDETKVLQVSGECVGNTRVDGRKGKEEEEEESCKWNETMDEINKVYVRHGVGEPSKIVWTAPHWRRRRSSVTFSSLVATTMHRCDQPD